MSGSSVSSSKSDRYDNTIFYKLVCKDSNVKDTYVGHTIDVSHRLQQHKYACHNPRDEHHNAPVYKCIRGNGGWDNWEVVIIECCKCNDFSSARLKEREYVEMLNASLNAYSPSRLEETVAEYKHNWWVDNLDRMKKMKREARLANIEEMRKKDRQRYSANIEEMRKKHAQFYKDNKEKINERQSSLVDCSCGKQYTKANKARHMKSKFHIDNSSD